MKKIVLNPALAVPGGILLLVGAFLSGDAMHGRFTNPLVPNATNADFSSLNDVYTLMKNNFDGKITDQAALDGAKAGLVAAGGDPYTTFMTAAQSKALNDDLGGKVSGIGAEIGQKNGLITVISPVKGSPAEKAGVRPGDIIAEIDGNDTSGLTVDQAVTKIRGKAGTQVKLKLARQDSDPVDVTITRADLTVPSTTWSLKDGNVGYINISRFGSDTAQLVEQAATELKGQGATKVVLDLRNNGGGYLDAGVAVSSTFLSPGKLVVEERTDGKTTNKLTASGIGPLVGVPTIVLINGGSASASEIVAGALRDNGAAKLLGEKSFGKGSVQEIKPVGGGAQLKVTVAHWYTPKGLNINKEGIKPDTEVKLTTADYNASRDPQLDAALQALR